MKRTLLTVLALGAGLLLAPLFAHADDGGQATLSAGGSTTLRTVKGERESAKFEEYRRIPQASAGDFWLNYDKEARFFHFKGTGLAQDDQRFSLSSGQYGKIKLDFTYDQIPHRFAYNGKTLYSGVGSGNLLIADRIQTDLQSSTSSADAATRISDYMGAATLTDLQLLRKRNRAELTLLRGGPLGVKMELNTEKREGTRPLGGSFGFGDTVEIPEPINYDTSDLKVTAEYVRNRTYLSSAYTTSKFDNNVSTVTWDNPFRATDSTAANAYILTYAGGPSMGRMDLYPSSKSSDLTLTGALSELPLSSRLALTASWGSMKQNDPFVPFTTNTAITQGAVTGTTGVTAPCDAFDLSCLPATSAHAKVDTTLMNLLWTAAPSRRLHLKAKYRTYERSNDTPEIDFVGYVRADAVWEAEEIKNEPLSYKTTTTSADAAYDLFDATALTVGYTADKMKRTHREVASQTDNSWKVSLDNHSADWLTLRASLLTGARNGEYDFRAPFEGEEGNPPQLPWLRKYDEARLGHNKWQLLATAYASPALTFTASAVLGKNNYNQSAFGLLHDESTLYSLDADYNLTERFGLHGFLTRENLNNTQKARHWSPTNPDGSGGVGDPYNTSNPNNQPPYDDPSNWTAQNESKVNTIGLGLNWNLSPKKLDFNLSYAFEKADGNTQFSSVVGGSSTTDNNNFTPAPFPQVDTTKRHTLDTGFKYHLLDDFALAFGYFWEKYDINDFTLNGFANIPTAPNGNFNGAVLLGALPKPYSASAWYMRFDWKF